MISKGSLERAVGLLGPLEGRIMRAVWSGAVAQPFAVGDMQALLAKLAYTTVMTTLRRLGDKGLLTMTREIGQRAYAYRAAGSPEQFLAQASAAAAEDVIERFGEAGLAAFAARLADLPSEQLDRLRKLAE